VVIAEATILKTLDENLSKVVGTVAYMLAPGRACSAARRSAIANNFCSWSGAGEFRGLSNSLPCLRLILRH
jgi:hypothetical protein